MAHQVGGVGESEAVVAVDIPVPGDSDTPLSSVSVSVSGRYFLEGPREKRSQYHTCAQNQGEE